MTPFKDGEMRYWCDPLDFVLMSKRVSIIFVLQLVNKPKATTHLEILGFCCVCWGFVQTDYPLQWRHNESDGVSNHQPRDCLLNRLFKAQIKENIKAPRHWPLCGEVIDDRWIPRTKGQERGRCLHLMTSSWSINNWWHNHKPDKTQQRRVHFHGIYCKWTQLYAKLLCTRVINTDTN